MSNPDTRPAQSLEFVRVAVGASEAGADVDPTGDAVSLAFVTEGSGVDGSTTFTAATWETDESDPDNTVFYARVLVGPGGSYVPVANTGVDIYVRVTDNPETPIRKSGTLRFT